MDEQKSAPALKDIFNSQRIEQIADQMSVVSSGFDRSRFLASCADMDRLSLMARVRRVAESLHLALPGSYSENIEALYPLAPQLDGGLAALVLPEYVALYGAEHFELSMAALKFFTVFGTSEYGVRHFLQRDLPRTLAVMESWTQDDNEHVRRLASEGSRPRLPWSFHITPLRLDPTALAAILEPLKDDPSLYVRRSVANSLNDITKDNPDWVLDRLERWPLDTEHGAWIAKHSLRSLIKQGNARALAVIGAGGTPQVALTELRASPSAIQLGQEIELAFTLSSLAGQSQRLVIDYALYYVKKSGAVSAKVFKLKTLELAGGAVVSIRKRQLITNFTTRQHYPGRHEIEILINGQVHGKTAFELLPS